MTSVELAYRASGDGIEERNELVMRELPQVYYVAARIRERLPKQVEMEDLVQAGVLGLLDACRNYDGSKDAQFSTFAKYRIRGAILDHACRHGGLKSIGIADCNHELSNAKLLANRRAQPR